MRQTMHFVHKLVFLLAIIGSGLSPAAADTLSDLQLYQRCWVRMVRAVPDPTDANYMAVSAGQMSGAQACLALFDTAAFNASGASAGQMKNPASATAKRVVKTFNELHRSWFSARNPAQPSAYTLINDVEEPALYYTRALFENAPLSSVVTLSTGLEGVRVRNVGATTGNTFQTQNVFNYPATSPFLGQTEFTSNYTQSIGNVDSAGKIKLTVTVTPYTVPDANLVEVGDLIGVKTPMPLKLPSFLATSDLTVRSEASAVLTNFPLNAHFGGGILGSQAYIQANNALNPMQLPNDVEYINRRMMGHMFSDLLCEQIPTLKTTDVASEVKATSPYPFETNVSCRQCHSSIDNAAFTLRNVFLSRSGPAAIGNTPMFFAAALPVEASSSVFALQAPAGRLHYRENLSNTLVDQNVTSLADLGAKIASGNDLYLCAAKRYYQFFTGIDVDLTSTATAPVDLLHQKFVVSLGQNLKKSQNLHALINAILSSDQFKTRDYMTTGVGN